MKKIELNKKNIFVLIGMFIITLGIFLFYKITYPFVLSFILAYILSPIYQKLRIFFPSAISSFISILLFLLIAFSTLSLSIPIIIAQFEKLAIIAPKYVNQLNELVLPYYKSILKVEDLDFKSIFDIFKMFLIKISDAGYNFFKGGLLILNSIFDFFLILILTFYMLLELKNIKSFLIKLTNNSNLKFCSNILQDIDITLSGYIRGQGTICLILSIFYSIILYFISLEFGFILGLFVGLISFIPYIGAVLGCILALFLGSMQFGYSYEIILIVFTFIFGQFLESYVLTPKFIGKTVKLNTIWIIFALSVGGGLFGFLGILMAIPIAAIIGVIARYIFYFIIEKSVNE